MFSSWVDTENTLRLLTRRRKNGIIYMVAIDFQKQNEKVVSLWDYLKAQESEGVYLHGCIHCLLWSGLWSLRCPHCHRDKQSGIKGKNR